MTASKRFFIYAFISGIIIRFFFVVYAIFYPKMMMWSDQLQYINSTEIFITYGFGEKFGSSHMPCYPLFLSFFSYCFPGGELLGGSMIVGTHSLIASLIFQNIIAIIAIFFIYKIGNLVSKNIANISGGVASLNLNMIVCSNQILTESIFYPIFTIFIYFLFSVFVYGKTRDIAYSSLFLGFSTLVRSVTMYIPFFILPFLFFLGKSIGVRVRLLRVSVFFCFFLFAVSPWLVRNYLVFDSFGLTSQGVGHITGWVIPGIEQYEKKIDIGAATISVGQRWREYQSLLPENIRHNPFLLDAEAKKYFGEYLLTVSPRSVGLAWFWGAAKNIFSPVAIELAHIFDMDWTHFYETSGGGFIEQAYNFLFKNKNKIYAFLIIAGICMMLLFRIVQFFGLWLIFQKKYIIIIPCFLLIIYFLIVSGPVGYAKYRLPLEPIFVFFTSIAFSKGNELNSKS